MNQSILSKIVKASGVSAGELVLVHFWGEDRDKEIANQMMAGVAALGATPVLLQQARSINQEIFGSAQESCFDERYFALFSRFDAVLDVFAYRPIVLGSSMEENPLEKAQMKLYRNYIAKLFYKLMECPRFIQIRIPTEANAEEAGLEPKEYIRRMEQAYDIDYDAIRQACQCEVERWSEVEKVAIYTGKDCVLWLELAGRSWHVDAGDGDLPCGEIYIAPVEDKSQGSVFFESCYLEDVKYSNVVLYVTDGEVVGSSHSDVTAYFAAQPRENRVVCEWGLGMNPGVTDLCGYTVLDEKMAGTFHIAVGANHMFGGKNRAAIHVDFVGCGKWEGIV